MLCWCSTHETREYSTNSCTHFTWTPTPVRKPRGGGMTSSRVNLLQAHHNRRNVCQIKRNNTQVHARTDNKIQTWKQETETALTPLIIPPRLWKTARPAINTGPWHLLICPLVSKVPATWPRQPWGTKLFCQLMATLCQTPQQCADYDIKEFLNRNAKTNSTSWCAEAFSSRKCWHVCVMCLNIPIFRPELHVFSDRKLLYIN